jgi:RNA polymerase sigma factor (sigma-70 family)
VCFPLSRHSGLVLNLCRQLLRHEQDAEDAFQATFLVFAKRAGSIRNPDSLAGWLYGVAYRTAMKLTKNRGLRIEDRESRGTEARLRSSIRDPAGEASLRELQSVLHEEVNRLPQKLRAPFVLCCLEGKSRAEAAQLLGWKAGTLSGRLAQARERLQQRLFRRGITLSAVLGAVAIGSKGAPATLVDATVQAALLFSAGKAAVSAQVLSLAEGVMKMIFISKVRANLMLALAATVMAVGIGFGAYQALPEKPAPSSEQAGKAGRHHAWTRPHPHYCTWCRPTSSAKAPSSPLVRKRWSKSRFGSSVSPGGRGQGEGGAGPTNLRICRITVLSCPLAMAIGLREQASTL